MNGVHASRLGRVRRVMDDRGVDCLFLSAGSDLPYLTGYTAPPLERPTMLVLPLKGEPVLVVPALEAARVPAVPFEVKTWTDSEDPFALIVRAARRPVVAAVGDETRAVFLLELFSHFTDTTFVPASPITAELRIRKDEGELAALRAAAVAVDAAAARLVDEVAFQGRTERDVARDVAGLLVDCGHDAALFTIVASGPNSASPHHEPGERVIEEGDVVVVDTGGRRDGYCSDLTRTFVVGGAGSEIVAVHGVVAAAVEAAKAAVHPGARAADVDKAARDVIADAGFGERFIHRTGHGIGLDVHEEPYLVEGSERTLDGGMVFSIEPGIYLPGSFGVRIEDICVVTSTGVAVLNAADRALVPVH